MLLTFVVFFCNLIFFIPLTSVYPIFEPVNQYAALLGYPLFYIYTRLLTVDDKISFKVHARYLVVPTLLFLLYILGIFLTPFEEYKTWVFQRGFTSDSVGIHFLKIIFILIRITFIIQIICTLTGNFILIKKYGSKAAFYYSDIDDTGVTKVQLMNVAMTTTAIVSILWTSLGRAYFVHEMTYNLLLPTIISVFVSFVFSAMFFSVGWMGMKQKVLNPTFELEVESEIEVNKLLAGSQDIILSKILILFNDKKMYLNANLTIQDIAQEIGTNRTYISTIINQRYNQNFCAFVNSFRVDELEKVVKENPRYSLEVLAENCGFGTVHSLKRAFEAKKQITYPDWKKQNLTDFIG